MEGTKQGKVPTLEPENVCLEENSAYFFKYSSRIIVFLEALGKLTKNLIY